MATVFADLFYFFALLNPRDPSHAKAVAFAQTYGGDVVTTGWVLTEWGDGWAKPARWRALFVQMLADLQANPDVRIVPASDSLLHEGVRLYGPRLDKNGR